MLAANLRRLRIARHLSLSELARATQISKATLSGVESGRSNPTVETLAALAGALRVTLGELLEEPRAGEVRVTRASQQAREAGRRSGRRVLETLPRSSADMEVAVLTLEPAQVHEGTPGGAGSRGQVYVVRGTLLAGPVERVTELAPGDYASFPTDVPHTFEARRHPVRALVLTESRR